ncbi:hypothetical protein [Salisediminibacterium selenitireducens]|uniref:hypothetical protein n=1 Tax=Salisediminibacterium selenitireducens TaxID=85683 RepID=UPI0003215BEE|nr:hypothetical protein [Salisediminibacterium selenitireducens]
MDTIYLKRETLELLEVSTIKSSSDNNNHQKEAEALVEYLLNDIEYSLYEIIKDFKDFTDSKVVLDEQDQRKLVELYLTSTLAMIVFEEKILRDEIDNILKWLDRSSSPQFKDNYRKFLDLFEQDMQDRIFEEIHNHRLFEGTSVFSTKSFNANKIGDFKERGKKNVRNIFDHHDNQGNNQLNDEIELDNEKNDINVVQTLRQSFNDREAWDLLLSSVMAVIFVSNLIYFISLVIAGSENMEGIYNELLLITAIFIVLSYNVYRNHYPYHHSTLYINPPVLSVKNNLIIAVTGSLIANLIMVIAFYSYYDQLIDSSVDHVSEGITHEETEERDGNEQADSQISENERVDDAKRNYLVSIADEMNFIYEELHYMSEYLYSDHYTLEEQIEELEFLYDVLYESAHRPLYNDDYMRILNDYYYAIELFAIFVNTIISDIENLGYISDQEFAQQVQYYEDGVELFYKGVEDFEFHLINLGEIDEYGVILDYYDDGDTI